MPTPDIFDDIIALLEQHKARGDQAVYLTPANRDAFFRERDAAATEVMTKPSPKVAKAAVANASRRPIPAQPDRGGPPVSQKVEPLTWEQLTTQLPTCTRCPLHLSRTQVVIGEGNPDARLMFIGEGPGHQEDQSGRPFVGPAGQLLTKMIKAMQFEREDVYIANIVKCRPPGNRNPTDEEAATCLPYLIRQIQLVKPEYIVLLGAVPLQQLLHRQGIMKTRGQWLEFEGIPVMPTFHPSFLLRSPRSKKDVWEDLQLVMCKLGLDPADTLRKNGGR